MKTCQYADAVSNTSQINYNIYNFIKLQIFNRGLFLYWIQNSSAPLLQINDHHPTIQPSQPSKHELIEFNDSSIFSEP